MTITFAAFAGALALSLLLTPAAGRLAFRFGVLDRPDRKLKTHGRVTPYLGGLAIFVATVAAVVGVKLAAGEGPWAGRIRGVVGMLAGATVVFALGLRDDVKPLRPHPKLAVQALAALIPIGLGVHIKFIENPWGAVPLTLLWLVGVTNAFNLLDIMDGLCAGLAVVAAGWFWVISAQNGRFNDAVTAAALAGAALGFLRYNRPPARIFMGDAGSLFIGYLLASMAIGQGYSLNTNLGVVAPLLILGVPIFETMFVMTIRWMQGKPAMQGSPDHVPLRLVRLGWTRPGATRLLWAAGAVLGGAAYAVTQVNWERALLITGAAAFVALIAAIRLAAVRMDPAARP